MYDSTGSCDGMSSVTNRHSDLLTEKKHLQDLLEAPRESQAIAVSIAHLAEVKNMQNPSDVIRGTLSATWLLLNAKRFEGKPVTFDEVRDWGRCQKMLADENFSANVQAFNTLELDSVPHVPHYVATHYFGLSTETVAEGSASLSSIRLGATNASLMPRYKMSRSELQSQDLRRFSSKTSNGLALPRSSLATSGKVAIMQRPKLTLQSVGRASKPCALLLEWMTGVIQEHRERSRLKRRLCEIELLLDDTSIDLEGRHPDTETTLEVAAPRQAQTGPLGHNMGLLTSSCEQKALSSAKATEVNSVEHRGPPSTLTRAPDTPFEETSSVRSPGESSSTIRPNLKSSTASGSFGTSSFAPFASVVTNKSKSTLQDIRRHLGSAPAKPAKMEPQALLPKLNQGVQSNIVSTSPVTNALSVNSCTSAFAPQASTVTGEAKDAEATPANAAAVTSVAKGCLEDQIATPLLDYPSDLASPSVALPQTTVEVKLIGDEAARVLEGSSSQIVFSRIGYGPLAERGTELEAFHVEKVLPQILSTWGIFKSWNLKLSIEGHQEETETPGKDLERSQAVMRWFLAQGCEPWQLREKSWADSKRFGSLAVAVPLKQLIATSGPLSPTLASFGAQPGLFFENNTAGLQKESKSVARAMGDWLYTFGANLRFQVEGHALASEDAESLAADRADIVAELLMSRGVKAHQLVTVSMGSLCPVTLRKEHEALNRRVELLMMS